MRFEKKKNMPTNVLIRTRFLWRAAFVQDSGPFKLPLVDVPYIAPRCQKDMKSSRAFGRGHGHCRRHPQAPRDGVAPRARTLLANALRMWGKR
jgi:hypothetical protein